MSKSLGNVVDPWSIIEKHGADALRWYFFTEGSPWTSRRVFDEAIEAVVRGPLLTLWNTYSFYVLYANVDGVDPTTIDVPIERRGELDRWVLSELSDTVATVTRALDGFDATGGGKRIAQLIDDLSNWYVRRSRRRFWKAAAADDQRAAHRTLWECLTTLAQLLAPYAPFLADEIWTNLMCEVRPDAPDSVHLSDWPDADERTIDSGLRSSMAAARRAVTLGLQARTNAKIKVRQPLAAAVLVGAGAADAARHAAIIGEELNVKSVRAAAELPDGWAAAEEGGLRVALDVIITGELRAEGWAREVVRGVQNLRKRSGLAVSDRIELRIDAGDQLWQELRPHLDWIAGEVLAAALERGPADAPEGEAEVRLDGERVTVALRRA
jgi:isoleucyl-tRNA synthetase